MLRISFTVVVVIDLIDLSISQLLHLSLKKAKVTSSEASALEMLDPFVLLLLDCLNSMHVKVRALFCAHGCLFLSPHP